jgi:hypothetical protein
MDPKAKYVAWVHVEVIEGLMYCKYCQKCIRGGIRRLKEQLVGLKGQVKSSEAPLDVIGPIREYMQKLLNEYQQEKAREKVIQAEIGRKRIVAQMRAANPTFDYEGSSSIPYTDVRYPLCYVYPPLESENTMHHPKSKKRNTIQRYFTPPPLLALTMPMFLKVNPLNLIPP